MTGEKEQCFWLRQDLKSREVLEYRVLPPDVWIEDMGLWVRWGPALILVQEGLPLAPLKEVVAEVEENGATPVQEDSAIAEDDAGVE